MAGVNPLKNYLESDLIPFDDILYNHIILDKVLKNLDVWDLMNCRFVCKQWAAAGIRHIRRINFREKRQIKIKNDGDLEDFPQLYSQRNEWIPTDAFTFELENFSTPALIDFMTGFQPTISRLALILSSDYLDPLSNEELHLILEAVGMNLVELHIIGLPLYVTAVKLGVRALEEAKVKLLPNLKTLRISGSARYHLDFILCNIPGGTLSSLELKDVVRQERRLAGGLKELFHVMNSQGHIASLREISLFVDELDYGDLPALQALGVHLTSLELVGRTKYFHDRFEDFLFDQRTGLTRLSLGVDSPSLREGGLDGLRKLKLQFRDQIWGFNCRNAFRNLEELCVEIDASLYSADVIRVQNAFATELEPLTSLRKLGISDEFTTPEFMENLCSRFPNLSALTLIYKRLERGGKDSIFPAMWNSVGLQENLEALTLRFKNPPYHLQLDLNLVFSGLSIDPTLNLGKKYIPFYGILDLTRCTILKLKNLRKLHIHSDIRLKLPLMDFCAIPILMKMESLKDLHLDVATHNLSNECQKQLAAKIPKFSCRGKLRKFNQGSFQFLLKSKPIADDLDDEYD